MTAPEIQRPLTTNEAALASGRHPVTIRKALESGDLHGSQISKRGQWRIKRACLEAYTEGVKCEHQASNVVSLQGRRRSGGAA